MPAGSGRRKSSVKFLLGETFELEVGHFNDMFTQSNYKLKCKSYTSSLITQNCAHDLNCTIIVLINNEIKRVTDFLRLKFLNTFIYMYAIWYFLQLLKYI